MINPLLKELSNNFKIPPFDIIKNSHFKEAVIFSISKQNSAIEKICSIRYDAYLHVSLWTCRITSVQKTKSQPKKSAAFGGRLLVLF